MATETIGGSVINPNERLAVLEATIERGLQTFIEVGKALLEIRDDRLYRQQGFTTFEAYCQERWNWSHRHANRQIEAARVVQNLGPIGPKPKNEAQARELARLPVEQQREVAASIDFTTATAADIRAAVDDHAGDMTETQQAVQQTSAKKSKPRPSEARKEAKGRASAETKPEPTPTPKKPAFDEAAMDKQILEHTTEALKAYMACPEKRRAEYKRRYYRKLEELWGPIEQDFGRD
jgi:hypothetical protein